MYLDRGLTRRASDVQVQTMHSLGYKSLLFVHNPASTMASTTPAVRQHLEATQAEHQLDIKIAETSVDFAENCAMLSRKADETTVIATKTGDGGLSKLFSAGHYLQLPMPFGVIPGGRKNDIAHDLLDAASLKNPVSMLLRGQIKPLHPIEITDNAGAISLAWAYASRGPSDKVGARVSNDDYRKRWFHKLPGLTMAAETIITAQELRHAQPYNVFIDGVGQEIIEYVIMHSELMAGNLKSGTHLLHPGLEVIIAPNRLQTFGKAIGMLAGRKVGRSLSAGASITFRSARPDFTHQRDGDQEAYKGMAYTELTYRLAAHSLNVLTTKSR